MGAGCFPCLPGTKATERRDAPAADRTQASSPEGPGDGGSPPRRVAEELASVGASAAITERSPPLSLPRAPREKPRESWARLAGGPSAGGGR